MPAKIDHPSARTLRRFIVGTTSPPENRAIVAHLLRRCARCSRAITETYGEPARPIVFQLNQRH